MPCPSEETLAAYLAGRAPPEGTPLAAHLDACPTCAGRLEALAAWRGALALAEGSGSAGERSARRMRKAWPGPRVPFQRWAPLAAAGFLALVSWLAWGLKPSPAPVAPAPSADPPTRILETRGAMQVLSLAQGSEILAGLGARLERDARARDGWLLNRGRCLATGEDLPLGAPGARFRIRGELLLTVGTVEEAPAPVALADIWMGAARAGAWERVEAVVLAGQVEAFVGIQRLLLVPGTRLVLDGEARTETLPPGDMARLRESFLRPRSGLADSVPFGKASRQGDGWELDACAGRAGWLAASPGPDYRACLRLKGLEAPSVIGLSFEVDGLPALWAPDPAFLADGHWHTLQVLVTPGWVTLVLDGLTRQRIPREGFKPNAVADARGVGLLVWNGRVQAEGLALEAMP